MKIQIKLNQNSKEILEKILNDNVELTENYSDILIYSDEYKKMIDFSKYKKTFCFEQRLKELMSEFKEYFKYYYDYYYLKRQLKKASSADADCIAVGSSYGVHGIDSVILKKNFVNLSMISQDFYYATKIAKFAIEKNSNIKTVYLCSGYYGFHADMSLCTSDGVPRVANVYNRLFNDVHNCVSLPQRVNIVMSHENFINKENLENYFGENLCDSIGEEYYYAIRAKNINEWILKTEEERINVGKNRAILHNNLIKHKKTYSENINLISEFNDYCADRNINIVLIVFPFTKYYMNYLTPDYEKEYKQALSIMNKNINFLDLNKVNIYENEDFTDSDHLNVKGAIKTSIILNKIDL